MCFTIEPRGGPGQRPPPPLHQVPEESQHFISLRSGMYAPPRTWRNHRVGRWKAQQDCKQPHTLRPRTVLSRNMRTSASFCVEVAAEDFRDVATFNQSNCLGRPRESPRRLGSWPSSPAEGSHGVESVVLCSGQSPSMAMPWNSAVLGP